MLNLLGYWTKHPITYKSLIQQAENSKYYYKVLAGISATSGITSMTGPLSWVFSPIQKAISVAGSAFGFYTGVKGALENDKLIKQYQKADQLTTKSAFLAQSKVGDFHHVTLVNQEGVDVFNNKYIIGNNPNIVSKKLSLADTLTPITTKNGLGYQKIGTTVLETHQEALYKPVIEGSNLFTNDLMTSIIVPPIEDAVKSQLNKKFNPSDVQSASKYTNRDEYIAHGLEEYNNSLSQKIKFWGNKNKDIENKTAELHSKADLYENILNEMNKIYSELTPDNNYSSLNDNQLQEAYTADKPLLHWQLSKDSGLGDDDVSFYGDDATNLVGDTFYDAEDNI